MLTPEQIKIHIDILLGVFVEEIKALINELVALKKSGANDGELMDKQLELAELVHYLTTNGLLEALRVHWPAMNPLFDKLIELRKNKKITEELNYLRSVNERRECK